MLNKILFGLISLLIVSCAVDTSTNTNNSNSGFLIPLKTNNFWVYKSNDIDANGNPVNSNTKLDSFVVGSAMNISGSNCFPLIHYIDGNLKDTIFLYDIQYKVYKLYSTANTQIPNLNNLWFPMLDNTVLTTWFILRSDFPYSVSFNDGNNYNSTRSIIYNGYKDSLVKVKIPGNDTLTTTQFHIIRDDKISFLQPLNLKDTANINIIDMQIERFWINPNIGIARWQFDVETRTISSDSVKSSFYKPSISTFSGNRRDLINYKVQ